MPRSLSATLTRSKNALESLDPWVFLVELDAPSFPLPIRLANDNVDMVFHEHTYFRFPMNFDAIEENTVGELQRLHITVGNVDQQLMSLLEHYWIPLVDPQWQVKIWQVAATMPDETPYGSYELFDVLGVQTDLLTAVFNLHASGFTMTALVPGRRYTSTNGFPNIVRTA
jgi:hypothetical protein